MDILRAETVKRVNPMSTLIVAMVHLCKLLLKVPIFLRGA